MACMKLGSKAEVLQREAQTWYCTSGPQSDVTIEIGEMSYHLHKFPLISRSALLEKLITETACTDESACVLQLSQLPGGAKAFELVAKVCYGIKIELNSMNVVSVRCAAEYLQMTEELCEGNLISQTEAFLNEVFVHWTDTIKALETCEEVLPQAEELHIVSRCIDSMASKACAYPLFMRTPVPGTSEPGRTTDAFCLNGIYAATKLHQPDDDWWYEDVSFLSLPLYKRFIQAVEAGGMRPEIIAGALAFYAKKYLPQMNRQSSFKNLNSTSTVPLPSEADQRALLEEIVELLPSQKGVVHNRFLLRLLQIAMALQASPSCRENLERRVGLQLDQAALEDLLIPNIDYPGETLYDIDCFQRILDHFLSIDQTSTAASPCIVEESELMKWTHHLSLLAIVADLVDAYLAEVAPDVNLKLPKFLSLAAAIPGHARTLSDGIYRAIDIYFKAHPWLTELEREEICRLMNCQKLSLEASTHVAQNERLPLRVIVQVLYFEQRRMRTSISGWFIATNNLDHSDDPSSVFTQSRNDGSHQRDQTTGTEEIGEHVSKLDNDYHSVGEQFLKLAKKLRIWNLFRRKSNLTNSKSSK